ncbi:MAG: cytochrome c peroxidase [Gemmatimonadota bacterium]
MRLRRLALTAAATAAMAAAAACVASSNAFRGLRSDVLLGLDPIVPTPIDNPPTSPKLALGARLFFDPILSADGTGTCASCHQPERAFGDSTRVSLGIRDQPTSRNAPPLVNRAWGRSFFRDGRAPSLEAAVLQPVQNPAELGVTLTELEARLAASPEYRRLFRTTFGASPAGPTAEQAAAALAVFIRSLQVGGAPVDRFHAGDSTALTPLQQEGRALFFGRARCSSCHIGTNFTDEGFHNTGVAVRSGDPGRFGVTRRADHTGAFRTPTLRETLRTAPYMHDGRLATLEEVIEFYDGGGVPNPNLDFQIRPLRLSSREKEALLAFLRALSSEG